MENFIYYTPTKVVFGKDEKKMLENLLKNLKQQKF